MKAAAVFEHSGLSATLWAFRREFLLVGLFSAVANLLMLTPTLYMLQVFDRVMVSHSEMTLLAVSLICLILLGLMALAEWTRSRLLVRAGVRLDERLGTRIFKASFEAHRDSGAPAHSANPAFNDLIRLRQFITGQGIFAFFDAPWTPIYIGVIFLLHPMLGWTAMVFACVQAALAWFGHRQAVAPAQAAARAQSDLNAYLHGKVRNVEVLESMGMVENLRHQWARRHQAFLQRDGTAQAVSNKVMAWSKFIRYAQQSLALGAGALLVIDGQLSAGGMIAANVLMTRALAPIDQLVGNWPHLITAKAAFARLDALLKYFPGRGAAPTQKPVSGEITLVDVCAGGAGRDKPILNNISFSVTAGSVVAVLGPSGSGKSTLARVMMGIWPGVKGQVLLDGLPIASWDRQALGPHLGYLPQDVGLLLEGSLAENIARFSAVDSAKVIKAARCAGLHDMILRFPKGYDTPIGEGGGLLSGGQRQRIGLARAVYGDPALVVLDEPNANLDDAGEAALMNTLAQLKAERKTVVLITHRAGAIGVADWLLRLDNGELVGKPEPSLAPSLLQPAG